MLAAVELDEFEEVEADAALVVSAGEDAVEAAGVEVVVGVHSLGK